ncbi:MAG TPA: hypothetical protein EYO73_10455, partial [Sulfurimonas sp.]|nr:hypothetical protein [Sulfurimonas sp.]
MKNKIVLSMGIISLLSIGAQGQSFEAVGCKAASMGGAGVASSRNAMASYYNPALLAKPDSAVELALGFGVGIVDQGAFESANDLADADFSEVIDKGVANVTSLTQSDVDSLSKSRDIILDMNNKAALVSVDAFLSVQVDSFSLGVMSLTEAGVYGKVSQDHDKLIFEDSGQYFDVESATPAVDVGQVTYEASSLEYAVNNNLTY